MAADHLRVKLARRILGLTSKIRVQHDSKKNLGFITQSSLDLNITQLSKIHISQYILIFFKFYYVQYVLTTLMFIFYLHRCQSFPQKTDVQIHPTFRFLGFLRFSIYTWFQNQSSLSSIIIF